MSYNEALFTTVFTQCLLASMLLVALARHYRRPAAPAACGIPVSGFGPIDLPFVILAVGFYSIRALTSLDYVGKPPSAPDSGSLLAYGVYIAFILVIYARYKQIRPGKEQERRNLYLCLFWVLAPILVTYAASQLVIGTDIGKWIMETTGAREEQSSIVMLKEAPWGTKAVLIAMAVLVAPFIEEITFRGYLYPFMKCHTGTVFAAVSTSLLFGIIHVSLLHAIPLTVFSLMLIWAYEKTRMIRVPVIAHVVFNSVTVLYILLNRDAS